MKRRIVSWLLAYHFARAGREKHPLWRRALGWACLIASIVIPIVAFGQDRAPRVVSFDWERRIGRAAEVHSNSKRPFWPGGVRPKKGSTEGRWWKPPGGTERYWVQLDNGERVELPLRVWSKLDRGSELARGE